MCKKNDAQVEISMQVLATLVAGQIAQKEHCTESFALNKFLLSTTCAMLFDKSTALWTCGPDYIANEYYAECATMRAP